MQSRQAPVDPDTRLLAGLTAWEELFGPKPISWPELRDLGVSLSPEEARAYLGRGLADARRGAAYQTLFEYHPELRATLDSQAGRLVAEVAAEVFDAAEAARTGKGRAEPPHHFLTKLSADVAPHPEKEFAHILAQPDSPSPSAWFATRVPGRAWRKAPGGTDSVCVLFYSTGVGSIDTIVAKITGRQDSRPDAASIHELYPEDPGYKGWWRLTRPVRKRLRSLREIPGHSLASGKTAPEAFRGNLFFAYWSFPGPEAVSKLLPPARRPRSS